MAVMWAIARMGYTSGLENGSEKNLGFLGFLKNLKSLGFTFFRFFLFFGQILYKPY